MSIFEGSHLNLLQGVSQQVPRSRLPGQLTSQVNMLSDIVTGLRRRPGTAVHKHLPNPSGTQGRHLKAFRADVSGVSCEVILNSHTGVLTLYNAQGSVIHEYPARDYLKTDDSNNLRVTSVGESLFIANVTRIPTGVVNNVGKAPTKHGYFFIRTGAISKTYSIRVSVPGSPDGVYAYSYTTPNGTDPSHPAQFEVGYIAQQLADQINIPNITVHREGAYVFLQNSSNDGADVTIVSGSGVQFLGVSGGGHVRQESDLPPLLPSQGDGYVMGTGMDNSYVYFKYSSERTAWLEVGAWGSVSSIENMPLEVYYDGDWKMGDGVFEGRNSGDDDSNPNPEFVNWGITGVASYQGRLVILSGPWVYLSASNNPTRFYRSTVTDLVDSDTIGIGSSATTSAAFVYAITFNKDLLLFSSEFQALIPGGNQALSPRNAQIQVTSHYGTDLTCSPVSAGRTLMFPFPRSSDYFGVQEMLPSPYTDAQYVSTDSTAHLPKYMPDRCRFIVSSSVANMVIFSPTGDPNSLIVHEYLWEGEEKLLKSWHKWTFPFEVHSAYFTGGIIRLLTISGDYLTLVNIDPRVGEIDTDLRRRPFLDLYVYIPPITSGLEVTVPEHLGGYGDDLRFVYSDGPLAGTQIGSEHVSGRTYRLNNSYTPHTLVVGLPYESSFAPSPPVIRDSQESPIGTNKMTLLRYYVIVADSGEFEVSAVDLQNDSGAINWEVSPVIWASPNLSLGSAPISGEQGVVISPRMNSSTSIITLSTDGVGELKVLSMEFVVRTLGRIRRL